jgi:hypothetical protein
MGETSAKGEVLIEMFEKRSRTSGGVLMIISIGDDWSKREDRRGFSANVFEAAKPLGLATFPAIIILLFK